MEKYVLSFNKDYKNIRNNIMIRSPGSGGQNAWVKILWSCLLVWS